MLVVLLFMIAFESYIILLLLLLLPMLCMLLFRGDCCYVLDDVLVKGEGEEDKGNIGLFIYVEADDWGDGRFVMMFMLRGAFCMFFIVIYIYICIIIFACIRIILYAILYNYFILNIKQYYALI